MKKYILLLLFCTSLISIQSQTTGITTYTSNYSAASSSLRQPVSQAPNGDIWIYNFFNGSPVKFSGTNFTYTLVNSTPVSTSIFATNSGVWYYSDYGDFSLFN
ncbi:MAG: hypothetical protein ABIP51_05860, partial [Bacteroidia bacterium]